MTRRHLYFGIALLSAALVWFLPVEMSTDARLVGAIFACTVALWVTEVLPLAVTALLIAPALVVTGVATPKEAFAAYSDPLLFLFIGGFFLAAAMARHGLDHRIASAVLRIGWVSQRPIRIHLALMVTAALLSMWVSNTATAAIMLPILLGAVVGKGKEGSERAIGSSLVTLAYACSIGGLGTVVGSPPNLIALRYLKEEAGQFGFVEWMGVAVPIMLALLVVTYFLSLRMGASDLAPCEFKTDARPWSRGEKATALSFALAVAGWSIPEVAAYAGVPFAAQVSERLPGGVVALIASLPLFIARDEKNELVLPWSAATGIDWGIIFLFGGGILLGTQMFDTGLATLIARGFVASTGITSGFALLVAATFFTIFFTEICSNTATANMFLPITVAIAHEMGVAATPVILGVAISASLAFMLPIATGPNAIVFGTGRVGGGLMIRFGFWLNLIGGVIVVAGVHLWWKLTGH